MRRGSLFWGFLIIILGGLLMLENLGFFESLGFSVWNLFWPLVIILVGIWFLWSATWGKRSLDVEEVAIERGAAQSSRVAFKHGAGKLLVRSGSRQENILEGKFTGGLDFDKKSNGERLDLVLKVPTRNFPWMPGEYRGLDWDVVLNPDTKYSLEVSSGANETRLLLGDVLLDELILEISASSTYVELSNRSQFTRVNVRSGAASLEFRVPEGVSARIRSTGGLSSLNVDQTRFPHRGRVYESPDYETATQRVEFDLESGLASIFIH